MKKNYLVICGIIATSIFVFESCKKDKEVSTPVSIQKDCLFTSSFDGQFYSEILYNTDRTKMVQTKSANPNSTDTSVSIYEYNGNIVKIKGLNGAVYTTHYLNNNGTLDSSITNSQGFYMRYDYKYNADGLLAQSTNEGSFGNYTFFTDLHYTYNDGNIIKCVSYEESGDSTVDRFDYYDDKPNYFAVSYQIQQMTGKQSKNLLKQVTNSDGTFTKYTYEFNADNYPIKMFQVTSENDSTTYVYKWSCK